MIGDASKKNRSGSGCSGQHRSSVAAVVIGRNEGKRLVRCLASVKEKVDHVIYVDSGSTDDSLAVARFASAEVIELDSSRPFTAARARNGGLQAVRAMASAVYVQFIDGDCELQADWINTARLFLDQNPNVAVVSGRLRERFPEASIYNRLCDREWNTPVGCTRACGGIAMMRIAALDPIGGFDPSLIAGEEPELCVRLRAKGWEIWRLDAEMALHDAAITRFGQWWKRARRSGYAAAQGMALHGVHEGHGMPTARAVLWGGVVPVSILMGATIVTPLAFVLMALYPAQIVRLALHSGGSRGDWEEASFLTLGKFPEMLGVIEYCILRLARRQRRIIEYK